MSVSGAGDMNGDGLADLLIGTPQDDAPGTNQGGKSYVVYGRTGATGIIDIESLSDRDGFEIMGANGSYSGTSVSAAGDVNGDGLDDLIVGAIYGFGGSAYVIFGGIDGAFVQTAVNQLGSAGTDLMTDTGVSQTIASGAGDDTLTATAASVLYGGAGNDTFVVGNAMITALASPFGSGGNADRLARISGGGGIDTISLSGSGLTFDLTHVANQAAGNPDGGSRLSSIERIDLTGTGNNTLVITAADVLDMSGFNIFTATGRHQVLVTGDTGDTVDLADGAGTTGWTLSGPQIIQSTMYNVWENDTTRAALYVDTHLAVI